MKIGILGGTFNPIHNGHLIIAEQVRIKFGLSKVLFIPCNIPYHKRSIHGLLDPAHNLCAGELQPSIPTPSGGSGQEPLRGVVGSKSLCSNCHTIGLASAKHRLAMVKSAIKDNSYFEVSDIEIKRGGLTYSIDTIRYLKNTYPAGTQFYFIIGVDSLPELPLWREINTIAKLCRFIAIDRPGFIRPKLGPSFRITYLAYPRIDISSSRIRQDIKQRRSVKYLVPISVQQYINNHKLYR